MVLGHEGVGVVAQVAEDVIDLKVGDRIGWGYEHDSCGRFQQCLSGHEQYCAKRHMYGMTEFDQGSLASHAVWREAFLFKIPDAMASEDAAPLMCDGATVFAPLHAFVKSSDRVGIIGVGGLGHLAIQFAAKMGCEVVVFSGTDSKREEATKIGAPEFVPMKGRDKLDLEHKIDHLSLCSISYDILEALDGNDALATYFGKLHIG
ncbi:MAG: hypothetical protein M1835_001414 [Candelina submexicana]|nr:MAG: hypothetical protein M1835_001414 [Candelina submexicana]